MLPQAPVFDFKKLVTDVFSLSGGERFSLLVDLPAGDCVDHPDWMERREMAALWKERLEELGFPVDPLITLPATGGHNRGLPSQVQQSGVVRDLAVVLGECEILLAMTEFSVTAPLARLLPEFPRLRVASMPGVQKRMEQSALAADYARVAERVQWLKGMLDRSIGARVGFESGHEMYFDLRFRKALADDGRCPPDYQGMRLINLPSGEAFQVPYEGEKAGMPSGTIGVLPVLRGEDAAQLFVEENRIVDVAGSGALASYYRDLFASEPACRNIAEFGLGCNEHAVVSGHLIEDEKAGFHWAFGRSEHMGGTVGPDAFRSPTSVLHQDVVYAPGSPIKASYIELIMDEGEDVMLMENEKYIFPETRRGRTA